MRNFAEDVGQFLGRNNGQSCQAKTEKDVSFDEATLDSAALFFNLKLCEINWNGCSERFFCGARSYKRFTADATKESLKADKDGCPVRCSDGTGVSRNKNISLFNCWFTVTSNKDAGPLLLYLSRIMKRVHVSDYLLSARNTLRKNTGRPADRTVMRAIRNEFTCSCSTPTLAAIVFRDKMAQQGGRAEVIRDTVHDFVLKFRWIGGCKKKEQQLYFRTILWNN